MKMDKVVGSGNDNFYTPPYAIKPILAYAPPPINGMVSFWTNRNFIDMELDENYFEIAKERIDKAIDAR